MPAAAPASRVRHSLHPVEEPQGGEPRTASRASTRVRCDVTASWHTIDGPVMGEAE